MFFLLQFMKSLASVSSPLMPLSTCILKGSDFDLDNSMCAISKELHSAVTYYRRLKCCRYITFSTVVVLRVSFALRLSLFAVVLVTLMLPVASPIRL